MSIRNTILALFLSLIWSCKTIKGNKQNSIIKVETTIDSILPIEPISWLDSNKVEFAESRYYSYNDTNFVYDSAIFILYRGWDEISKDGYFPINENGQWISTISNIKANSSLELKYIDSILKDKRSFESRPTFSEVYHSPLEAIVYIKNKKVIGQTIIGFNYKTVKSTIKLGNGSFYSLLNKKQFHQIIKVIYDAFPSN